MRSTLKVTKLASSDTERNGKPGIPEFLMCTVEHGRSPPVLVSVIYRPPHVPFLKHPGLTDRLKTFCGDYSHKIIMGDLNANFLSQSGDAKLVRKLASELSLQTVAHRHTDSSRTWIDVILVDENDVICDASNEMPPFNNRHNIISVTVSTQVPAQDAESFYYRDYKNIRPNSLLEFLRSCDWAAFDTPNCDLDTKLNQLNANLTEANDAVAPVKSFIPRKGKLPCVDVELKTLYRKRDTVYKRYRRTKKERFLTEFYELRSLSEARTKQARTTYYQNRLFSAEGSNNIWKELRSLGLLPKLKGVNLGFTPEDLNTHFTRVSISNTESQENIENILSAACENGFKFEPVTLADVILKKLFP